MSDCYRASAGQGDRAGRSRVTLRLHLTQPAASDKLAEVADSGDMGQIVAQVKQVGEACKNCHEGFRKPKAESFRNQQ